MIMIVKLGPGSKEQISVNTPLYKDNQTVEPTACRGISNLPCKSYIFRQRVRKVILNEEK